MKYEAPICEWFEIKAEDVIRTSPVTGNVGGLEAQPNGDTDTPGVDQDFT